jgi:cbb3-type cytochrome oxidase maturation protein
MNVLLIMIPLSLALLAGAVAAFFWAVDHNQFDDMDTPALLPLDDDPSGIEWPTDDLPDQREAGPVAATDRDRTSWLKCR